MRNDPPPQEPAPRGSFADRLRAAVADRGRLCVGIDPHPQLLESWGQPVDASGLAAFAEICVQALSDDVAVVKPQVALFEEYGSAGIAVLERTIAALRDAGVLVIADGKRGDIGSTMAAYARAWLADGAPLASDALTAAPYLGFESLRPALDAAAACRRGVFVLARTSNPEGAALQTARTAPTASGRSGTAVGQMIVDAAGAEAGGTAGLVVGATRAHGLDLGAFDGPVLAPGLGAQGAEPADLAEIFAGFPGTLLPNSSRAVLRRGPDASGLRDAARRTRDGIEAALR